MQVQDSVDSLSQRSGWTFWLLMAGLATTLGASLPVGFNIGVMNAPADIIKAFCKESVYTRFDAVLGKTELDILWSSIVSIFLIGGVTGSLTEPWMADRLGRKGTYIVATVFNIIGAIMFYGSKPANSVEMLIVGRFSVGLAAGIITCVVPMYLTEIAPLSKRGAMGVMCPLGVCTGVLVAQIVSLEELLGTEETWPDLLAIFALLIFVCLIVIPFLPESPKYLYVVKNNQQQAYKELSKIRGLPISSLSEEIYSLQVSQRNDGNSNVSWNLRSVVRNRDFLLPILLVCFMQGGQQLSGINAVFFYSVSIFQATGLTTQESQYANIGCGCINLLMAIIAIPTMTRFNRRTLFLFSLITAAFWLIVLGLSIALIDSISWMPYISILSMLAFVFFYGLGLGPIPYFIGSELFDVGPRPSAMALGSMASWGCNFIVGMTFPVISSVIGSGAFGIFAAITIALFFFIKKYFPETRGKDPIEIAQLLKYGLSSRPLNSPTNSIRTDETNSIEADEKSVKV